MVYKVNEGPISIVGYSISCCVAEFCYNTGFSLFDREVNAQLRNIPFTTTLRRYG
jgi:hypothetical protein